MFYLPLNVRSLPQLQETAQCQQNQQALHLSSRSGLNAPDPGRLYLSPTSLTLCRPVHRTPNCTSFEASYFSGRRERDGDVRFTFKVGFVVDEHQNGVRWPFRN